MKAMAPSRKPITDGIDERARIRIVKGIQNHTTPNAAPVISDAVGTRPSGRARGVSTISTVSAGGVGTSSIGVVTATMPSTYGLVAPPDTAIPRQHSGG